MAHYTCQRCETDLFTTNPPHLCKDIRSRLSMYRNERKQHLLRLIRGRRCEKHGTRMQVICGTLSCGMCYIEEPFRIPKAAKPIPDGPLIPHFNGHGQKAKETP